MSCYNHPKLPTLARCERCEVEMCGKCTRFIDTGKYCERCTEAAAVESFINAKAQTDGTDTDALLNSVDGNLAARRPDKDSVYIWGGVGGSALMICLSMLLYSFQSSFGLDFVSELRKQDLALENCRRVFENIGEVLQDGSLPDDSLRCTDSVGPNIVNVDGDFVRVAHPNPGIHGYSQIYVTSESNEVIFVPYDDQSMDRSSGANNTLVALRRDGNAAQVRNSE